MEFPSLINDLVIRSATGHTVERVPVWIMRQAGRYLPEFREVRKQHDFFTICRTPELAAKVTLQPIERFALDAAIIFSDILVVPQALGMDVQMLPGEGSVLPKPLTSPDQIKTLTWNNTSELQYVYDAITLTRHKLLGKVPLIGFSGAPFTLMCYMIEGKGSKTQSNAKKWLYQKPDQSHELLDKLSDFIIEYLTGQVKAGAQMLQVFESSGGFLGPELFEKFARPCLMKIAKGVNSAQKAMGLEPVPIVLFAKDCHYATASIVSDPDCPYHVVGLDWTQSGKSVREAATSAISLQGNMDPCALYAPPDEIRRIVRSMLQEFGTQRYIANLGHGIYPDMDPESVEVFVNSIHEESEKMIRDGAK